MIGVSFVLALCQWGRFSNGKNGLIENAIQNKHWAGKAGETFENLKSRYVFFIFGFRCYFRSSDLYKAMYEFKMKQYRVQ